MENYQQYAEICNQIKELEEKKKLMSVSILEDLESRGASQLKLDAGTFSIVERKTWKYSSTVKTKELELKTAKKIEEMDGSAESTISKSVMFRGNKITE